VRLVRSKDVVGQRLEDVHVVVHLGTSRILELNHTAGRFWELLEEESDPIAIGRRLQAEFDVDDVQLSDEVERLVSALAAEKLVSVVDRG
jgi:hypothetical protein